MTERKILAANPSPQWVVDALKKAKKEGIIEISLDGRTWKYVNKIPAGNIGGWVTDDVTPEERQQVFDDIERRERERWK